MYEKILPLNYYVKLFYKIYICEKTFKRSCLGKVFETEKHL